MKYFLHDTSALDDERVSELYMRHGYEGVGLFYCFLEKIGKQEKPIKTLVLKRQLGVGKKLEKCWSFMEEIGLISSSNGESFNKQLINFSEKYKIKKENNAKRISQWREKQSVTENVTRNEHVRNNPNSIVSNSIIDNTINSIITEDSKEPSLNFTLREYWLKELHYGWTYSAAHGKALKGIISKTKTILKASGKESTDERVIETFKAMCTRLPDWYKDKDLPVLNSKFNEIIEQIKNQTNGKSITVKQQPVSRYAPA